MNDIFASAKVEARVVNPYTVVFRGSEGVTIGGEDVMEITRLAIERMPGDFGIISDRLFEFAIEPVSFYREVNAIMQLKAIAIVSYRSATAAIATIEQGLCEKPIAVFDNIDAAQRWIDAQLKPTPV